MLLGKGLMVGYPPWKLLFFTNNLFYPVTSHTGTDDKPGATRSFNSGGVLLSTEKVPITFDFHSALLMNSFE